MAAAPQQGHAAGQARAQDIDPNQHASLVAAPAGQAWVAGLEVRDQAFVDRGTAFDDGFSVGGDRIRRRCRFERRRLDGVDSLLGTRCPPCRVAAGRRPRHRFMPGVVHARNHPWSCSRFRLGAGRVRDVPVVEPCGNPLDRLHRRDPGFRRGRARWRSRLGAGGGGDEHGGLIGRQKRRDLRRGDFR